MDDIARCTCTAQPPLQMFDDRQLFQELVARMLEKDPHRRCTVSEVASHRWFGSAPGRPIDPQVAQNIKEFSRKSEAQLKISELMLDRYNVGNLNLLNQAFVSMDRDMSGTITVEEARQGASNVAAQLGLSQEEIE